MFRQEFHQRSSEYNTFGVVQSRVDIFIFNFSGYICKNGFLLGIRTINSEQQMGNYFLGHHLECVI